MIRPNANEMPSRSAPGDRRRAVARERERRDDRARPDQHQQRRAKRLGEGALPQRVRLHPLSLLTDWDCDSTMSNRVCGTYSSEWRVKHPPACAVLPGSRDRPFPSQRPRGHARRRAGRRRSGRRSRRRHRHLRRRLRPPRRRPYRRAAPPREGRERDPRRQVRRLRADGRHGARARDREAVRRRPDARASASAAAARPCKTKRVKLKPRPEGDRHVPARLQGRSPRAATRSSPRHKASPQLEALRSRAARVRVLTPAIAAGQRGAIVRLLQRRLFKRSTTHVAAQRASTTRSTQRAVMAWRKVSGVARNYSASSVVIRGVLAGKGRFKGRYHKEGRHVEADLAPGAQLDRRQEGPARSTTRPRERPVRRPCSAATRSTARTWARTVFSGWFYASYFIGG